MSNRALRRLALWGAALACLSALLGCSASSIRIISGGGTDSGTVVVTILQKGGGALVVEAVVIIGGERGTLQAGDTEVSIPDVPFGESTDQPTQPMSVTAAGFVTLLQTVTLSTSGETTVTVELETADPDTTGTVSGTVTDFETDDPVVSATIAFSPDIPGTTVSVAGVTDKDGQYTVGGIPTGNVVVKATADAYVSEERKIVVVQDTGGAGNADENFTLAGSSSTATVSGWVTDLITRGPVEGAQVKIADNDAVDTQADGSFEVTEVPVGDQTVTVTKAGYDPATRTIAVTPNMADVNIELAPTEDAPPPSPATITGTVTVRNRQDSSGVTVKAVRTIDGATLGETLTDTDGNYGLFVPPGTYRIEVSLDTVSISKTVTLQGAGRVLTAVDFEITAP